MESAVSKPCSNGPVEGQINRLKMLKRQMYGRAGIELLRARLLPEPAFSDPYCTKIASEPIYLKKSDPEMT